MIKKWFTLIEMLIVIVINSILLAFTIGISWDRIQMLKTKSVQEQFVYNYSSLFSRNLLTNYNNWKLYDSLTIQMPLWGENIKYTYSYFDATEYSWTDRVQWGKYKIKNLFFEWNQSNITLQTVDIKFEPYVLWCEILSPNKTWEVLDIDLLVNDGKISCFKIDSKFCRLENRECDQQK